MIIDGKTVDCKFTASEKFFVKYEEHKNIDRFVFCRVIPPPVKRQYPHSFITESGCCIICIWVEKKNMIHLINEGVFNKSCEGRITCNGKSNFEKLIKHNLCKSMWNWNESYNELSGITPTYTRADLTNFFCNKGN
jgi:hypothetical protein